MFLSPEKVHDLQKRNELAFSQEFSLIRSNEYPFRLLSLMEQAKERVWLQTMNLENDHMASLIFNQLSLLARTGVDVRLNVDGFNNMVTDGNLNVAPSLSSQNRNYRSFRIASKQDALRKMEENGVTITNTNWPVAPLRYFFPPVGRNHIKLALVDNRGFLGGINLSDKDFLREDTMLEILDEEILQGLSCAFQTSSAQSFLESAILSSNESSKLLMDFGTQSESIILETVRDMILNAQDSIAICTQFAPDSFLTDLINRIKKSVDIQLVVSDPRFIDEKNAWLFDRMDRIKAQLRGIKLNLFPGWLHTKLITADIDTPNRKAIYGTHNFVLKGSKWKNQELALYTENNKLLQIFSNYMNEIRATTY